MDFHDKLPRNLKEFPVYIAVISLISVNILAPLITCFELHQFSFSVWKAVLPVIPRIWIVVILLVPVTYKPAQLLTDLFVKKSDSFRAVITINILCTVFLMSIILTIAGTWIGMHSVSMEPVVHFFYRWPRNFSLSFAVELLIAQPAARHILYVYHMHTDADGLRS
jgi:hypothetical protein